MEKGVCKCRCGHTFQINEKEGSTPRCPSCGGMVTFPSKEMDTERREEFERSIEATCEVLSEGDNDLCPLSGSR